MDREQRERVSAEPQDEHLRHDLPRDEEKVVTAEPALRALLSQAISDRDIPRRQQRKAALLVLFQAIPTTERDPLRTRLHDPKDTLGHLFRTALSIMLRAQLFATLDGAVIPALVSAGSVEMAAFAATLQPARFHPAAQVVLDGAWRTSQTVAIVAVPGVGPPADEPGPRVHWRLMDRTGERCAGGMVTWVPGHGAPPAIQVTIDQPGRWTVALEFVDRGQVIAVVETPIRARSASERGDDLPMLLGGNALATSAGAMSDPQIGAQLGMLRTQLGTPPLGSRRPDDPTYRRLAPAIEELQWQQHQRGLPAGSEPTPSFEARSFDASTPGHRAVIQQAIDALIGRHGIAGARAQLHDLVVPPPGASQGAGVEPAAWDPHASEIERVLQAELALRSAEAASFLERFDQQGRAIAFGLLAQSEARLRAELQRYGLTQAPAQTGGCDGQGPTGSDVTALRDAIDQVNKKLGDLHATRDHITDGSLSIFGVPKVVELVKSNLHVAPGSAHDGIVNERAAHAHDAEDDSGVLALLSAIAPNKLHR